MPEIAMHITGSISSFKTAYITDGSLNWVALPPDRAAGLFREMIVAAMQRLPEALAQAGKAA
ncbi:hypothetical protein [Neorhizobium alkalisoli]|uniref:hypothetical protein n=1 Tax=Neorhizobium alkalisoli TaxID=528178 RepID=UPI000CF8BA3E|nr:hypothetical protein [Neorhizobium alkalisoli]